MFGKNTQNFGKLFRQKQSFLAKVYLLLAFQISLTAIVIWWLRQHPKTHESLRKWWILWFVLSILILLVLLFTDLPTPLKFVLISCFSILIGFNSIAAHQKVSPELIEKAMLITLLIFVTMTVIGFGLAASGVDISFMGYILTLVLIALIIGWIVVIFGKVSKGFVRALLMIGIVLFTIYIAYDTNVILQRSYKDDFVSASINFYLDIINLFSNLVGFDLLSE